MPRQFSAIKAQVVVRRAQRVFHGLGGSLILPEPFLRVPLRGSEFKALVVLFKGSVGGLGFLSSLYPQQLETIRNSRRTNMRKASLWDVGPLANPVKSPAHALKQLRRTSAEAHDAKVSHARLQRGTGVCQGCTFVLVRFLQTHPPKALRLGTPEPLATLVSDSPLPAKSGVMGVLHTGCRSQEKVKPFSKGIYKV